MTAKPKSVAPPEGSSEETFEQTLTVKPSEPITILSGNRLLFHGEQIKTITLKR